jgi:hypothetical protein
MQKEFEMWLKWKSACQGQVQTMVLPKRKKAKPTNQTIQRFFT